LFQRIEALQAIANDEVGNSKMTGMQGNSRVQYGPDGVIISIPDHTPITLSPFLGQMAVCAVEEPRKCHEALPTIAGIVAIGCQGAATADETAAGQSAVWLFAVMTSGDAASRPAAHSTGAVADALAKIGYVRNDFRSLFETAFDIGEGSFGKVHALRRNLGPTDQYFAGKVYQRATPSEVAIEASFLVTSNQRSHPNIIKFFGLYCTPQSWAMVLEYCSDGDLQAYISNHGQFTEESGLDVVGRGLFAAISHIHSLGIVHRDVKPENVLVDRLPDAVEPHRTVLVDFGIACRTSDREELARCCGSPGSIAPEVLRRSLQSPKADVFGGAVVLYFAMGGKMPFRGLDLTETLRANARARVRFWTSFRKVSDFSKDMLRVFLHADPSRRPSSSQAFEHLTQLLALLESSSASPPHRGDFRDSLPPPPLVGRFPQTSSTSTEAARTELQPASDGASQNVLSETAACTVAASAMTSAIYAPASPKPKCQHLRSLLQKQQAEAQILQRDGDSFVPSCASATPCETESEEMSSSQNTTTDPQHEATSWHALNQ
jgi:serine/threonine protein kinase